MNIDEIRKEIEVNKSFSVEFYRLSYDALITEKNLYYFLLKERLVDKVPSHFIEKFKDFLEN